MSSGRIGLLLPSSNTTMEPDFYRMMPKNITVHSTRMTLRSVTIKELEIMSREAVKAAELLATADVNVIVFGCTSGSLLRGIEWEKSLVSIIENKTNISTISTAGAVVEGLKALGIRRVSVITPYTDELNLLEKSFLEAHGFVVPTIRGLGLVDNLKISRVDTKIVRDIVEEVSGDSDGIFISCTNLPVIHLIEDFEEKLGHPVVTSNQTSMWAALKKLEHQGVNGYGKLLKTI